MGFGLKESEREGKGFEVTNGASRLESDELTMVEVDRSRAEQAVQILSD